MTDLEIARKLYDTWDIFGGRSLGDWNQGFCREAWAEVVQEARLLLSERPTLLSEEST